MHRAAFEGRSQRTKLVKHHSQAPDVRLEAVGTAFDNLWTKVVWGPDHTPSHVHCMCQHSRNSEIAHLNDVLLSHEHILALDISVQNLAIVDVFQT